jgi:NAD+ diphosphatase
VPGFFDGWPVAEPSQRNGFAHNRINRQSEQRSADVLDRALADPAARFYLFAGDKALVRPAVEPPDPLFTLTEAEALGADRAAIVLLGWNDAAPRLAVFVGADADLEPLAIEARDLRGLVNQAVLQPPDLGALAQARSLLFWHDRHGFCARCGAATVIVEGGVRRDCPACGTQHFPRTDPVVIMLAIDGDNCLLGRSQRFASGWYSCLAGFVEPGETFEAAVRREIGEEAGIRIGRVRYHASQPWPFPSMLMIGCHAEAVSRDIVIDRTELEDARWFPRDEVRQMLARTHPDGLATPPPFAIASELMRSWVEAGAG